MKPLIYHVCKAAEWRVAQESGVYQGSSQDQEDGFIHFSDRSQVEESTAKHRQGQDDLVLLAVDADQLGTYLKWEPSRRGQLFPHLYGTLPLAAVVAVYPLRLGEDGKHRFPARY